MIPRRNILFILVGAMLILCACGPAQSQGGITSSNLPAQGDPAHGADIFNNGKGDAPACATCHNLDTTTKIGPGLSGLSDRAGSRVSGQSAREYVFTHIAAPGTYVVPGFGNIMYNQYATKLSPQDIADVMAFVLGPATGGK